MLRCFALLAMLVLLCSTSCGERTCETPEPQEPECEYPTMLHPLSPQTLDSLRTAYAAQNPGVYVNLNEYGFPRSLRAAREWHLPKSLDDATLIGRAKAAIVANARVTGVSDSSSLHLLSYSRDKGVFMVWFGPQICKGLEVLDTHIGVWVDSVGVVAMDGNYYQGVCVPHVGLVPASQAQDSILGLKITFYPDGGPDTFVVAGDSFRGVPAREIVVHQLTSAVELRVAWRIPVGPGESPWWYVYVDTMDGERLGVEQLVDF
ncbi:MAG TPA: hypothetical protein VMU02_04415 [bacterium]|nr:hypothetical protein [bacterium]